MTLPDSQKASFTQSYKLSDCPACGKPLVGIMAWEVEIGDGETALRPATVRAKGLSISHNCTPAMIR